MCRNLMILADSHPVLGYTTMLTMQTTEYPIQAWQEHSLVQYPAMDAHHLTLVGLLDAIPQTDDAELMPLWARIIAATQVHFDDEDRWMQESDYPAAHCHMGQHALVLSILREAEAQGHGGNKTVIRQLAMDLSAWLPQHIDMMDAGLALHLQRLEAAALTDASSR